MADSADELHVSREELFARHHRTDAEAVRFMIEEHAREKTLSQLVNHALATPRFEEVSHLVTPEERERIVQSALLHVGEQITKITKEKGRQSQLRRKEVEVLVARMRRWANG